MKFKFLISLLAIVLVAGCTIPDLSNLGGTQIIGTSGKGLEITTFTADPSPVYSGATVRVTMEVENDGGTTVNQTKALAYLTGSDVNLGSTNTMYWTSSDTEYKPFTRDMRAADVVKGTSADTTRFTWSLKAPVITAGQTRTDTLYGRVYCDYATAVNGNVWVYTEGEADAAKASGRSLNAASFTSTSGPVGLNVKVSPDPVIYYSDSTNGETFSLYITVSNLASGTIYLKGKTYPQDGTTSFSIADTEYNNVTVSIKYDTSTLSLGNPLDCTGQQALPAGKSTTLVCDFTIPYANKPATFQSYPITITADYGYFSERSATVTVQGK
jgi:hypothetical protein